MAMNDMLADALSKISHYAKLHKSEVILQRTKLLKRVLELLQKFEYIGAIEEINEGPKGYLKVQLVGTINKCGVIKPRFSVQTDDLEIYERRFLLAKNFGIIIISTSKHGLITQNEAAELGVGGTLIGYCY